MILSGHPWPAGECRKRDFYDTPLLRNLQTVVRHSFAPLLRSWQFRAVTPYLRAFPQVRPPASPDAEWVRSPQSAARGQCSSPAADRGPWTILIFCDPLLPLCFWRSTRGLEGR